MADGKLDDSIMTAVESMNMRSQPTSKAKRHPRGRNYPIDPTHPEILTVGSGVI